MNQSLARRIATGCLIPATLTPRADWHERWKNINAAAGVIVGFLFGEDHIAALADNQVEEVARAFAEICGELEAAEHPATAAIWAQCDELIAGLRKRVAERLLLMSCESVEAVEGALAAIQKARKQ